MMRRRWNMKIERPNEHNLKIWSTNRATNQVEFDSTNNLSEYKRSDLANIELFLRENDEFELADKIKQHLGKIIRANDFDGELVPDGNYQVNIPLRDFKRVMTNYIDEQGLELSPNFQRKDVWSLKQRIAYVEFIIKGGSSNPIYLNDPSWRDFKQPHDFVVVDGKQRITTLLQFLNNEFAIFAERDPDHIGYYAKDFDRIPNDIILVVNDLPTRVLVIEWYIQMIVGGVNHTKKELDLAKQTLIEEKQKAEVPRTK